MRRNNKGFSLVELIVVIAIMVILTGLISMGVGMAVSKPADECVAKIKSTLQNIRVTTMGKYDAHVEIYKQNNQIYAKEIMVEDSTGTTSTKVNLVGTKGVQLFYELDSSGTYVELVEGGPSLLIYYDRSSGAFSKATSGYYCTRIKAVKGTKQAVLRLYSLTGKIAEE